MKIATVGLSPDFDDEDAAKQIREISEFWNVVRSCDETGHTSWEVIEPLEREVTEYLASRPPDVARATSTTFKAMLLMSGDTEL